MRLFFIVFFLLIQIACSGDSRVSRTSEWKDLEQNAQRIRKTNLSELFAQDSIRAKRFSINTLGIHFDYSKNLIDEKILKHLMRLLHSVDLKKEIHKMFRGEKINETEKRAVLHTALRNRSGQPVYVDGVDVMPKVKQVLEKMRKFSTQIRAGAWKGATGKNIKAIVSIGIGGSNLGPLMATEALKIFSDRSIDVKYVANIDGADIVETLRDLDPLTTLFIIESKSFTTSETMKNAQTAKKWFLRKGSSNLQDIKKHFVAVSTNTVGVEKFGIDPKNMFEFWDWVGGRYSLSSAIGLPLMIAIGADNFFKMLDGFFQMDLHFVNEPFEKNIPAIMGALSIWNRNFLKLNVQCIAPYSQALHRFPAYLQQAFMESNGKRTTRKGKVVDYQTGHIVFGEAATNSQHSYFQRIHQAPSGSETPVDFIGFVNSQYEKSAPGHHDMLMANYFAQMEALAFGKSYQKVLDELINSGLSEVEAKKLAPHKVFPGNRPTTMILAQELTPEMLGKLIAMYEHQIFVESIVWDIYAFDQWGVQLGKVLAKKILSEMKDKNVRQNAKHDSSTDAGIDYYLKNRL